MKAKEFKDLQEAYLDVYYKQFPNEKVIEQLSTYIVECIGYAFFSCGYTANDLISYFAEENLDIIIEDFIKIQNGNYVIENFENNTGYIEEQFFILNESWANAIPVALRVASAGIKAAKYVPKGAALATRARAALGGAGRAATRVSTQGSSPTVARATQYIKNSPEGRAVQRAAQSLKSQFSNVKKSAENLISKRNPPVGGARSSGGPSFRTNPVTTAVNKYYGGGTLLDRAATLGMAVDQARKVFNPNDNIITALRNTATSIKNTGVPTSKQQNYIGSSEAAVKANRVIDSAKKNSRPDAYKNNKTEYSASGGNLAFKAGGGKSAMKGNKTVADVQRQGMKNIRSSETTPNTAAGFDKAFADARRLNRNTFKWRGGEYTTQLAHVDLLDLINGYLINEGYADTMEGAEVIFENMSSEWLEDIVELLTVNTLT